MKNLIVAILILTGCNVVYPPIDPVLAPADGLSMEPVLPSTYRYTINVDPTQDKNGLAATDFLSQILVGGEHWSPMGAEFIVDDTSPRHIYCADWDMSPAIGVTNGAGIALNCLYLINNLPDESDQTRVIEHEIGHAFGLQHVHEPYAVMGPALLVNQGSGLTQFDVREFYRVHTDDNRPVPQGYPAPVLPDHDGESNPNNAP